MMRKTALAAALILGGAATAGAAPAMKVTSPDIKPGAKIAEEQVANGFGCDGKNISPAISWSGAPKGTKSFALSIFDSDAPTGSGFWHWVVFDIPPETTSLPKNAGDPKANLMPPGVVQSGNDAGTKGYFGPCPPKGDKPHHYHVTVFAVDVDKLDANESSTAAVVGFNLHFHTLAKGVLTGVYGR
ncbi:MAG TPA: YbhB/YbcL family Raf kinase inhibitor-like protein [Roseiarcus sp.]|nr:YbhB/YbcL family Raf kinase inhibitor-like protein [Roseiarcus sp.]